MKRKRLKGNWLLRKTAKQNKIKSRAVVLMREPQKTHRPADQSRGGEAARWANCLRPASGACRMSERESGSGEGGSSSLFKSVAGSAAKQTKTLQHPLANPSSCRPPSPGPSPVTQERSGCLLACLHPPLLLHQLSVDLRGSHAWVLGRGEWLIRTNPECHQHHKHCFSCSLPVHFVMLLFILNHIERRCCCRR